MEQYIWQIITSVVTLFFGGTSIIQLINNRELKRKLSAEATQQETGNDNIIIAGLQAEVGRLQTRISDMDDRYMKLEHKYYDLLEQITIIKENEQRAKMNKKETAAYVYQQKKKR